MQSIAIALAFITALLFVSSSVSQTTTCNPGTTFPSIKTAPAPANTCCYKLDTATSELPFLTLPAPQPNSPGDISLSQNLTFVHADGSAPAAGETCNGDYAEYWNGTEWTQTYVGCNGVTYQTIDVMYAVGFGVNARTIQTWQANLPSILNDAVIRLWMTCENGNYGCAEYVAEASSADVSCGGGSSVSSSSGVQTVLVPAATSGEADNDTTISSSSSAVVPSTCNPMTTEPHLSTAPAPPNTCCYKLDTETPVLPLLELPLPQPNSPGDISLSQNLTFVHADGSAPAAGQTCNGDYAEYWNGTGWTQTYIGCDGQIQNVIDVMYAVGFGVNARTIQTWQANLPSVLNNTVVRLWMTCENGNYGCAEYVTVASYGGSANDLCNGQFDATTNTIGTTYNAAQYSNPLSITIIIAALFVSISIIYL